MIPGTPPAPSGLTRFARVKEEEVELAMRQTPCKRRFCRLCQLAGHSKDDSMQQTHDTSLCKEPEEGVEKKLATEVTALALPSSAPTPPPAPEEQPPKRQKSQTAPAGAPSFGGVVLDVTRMVSFSATGYIFAGGPVGATIGFAAACVKSVL
mmetsp:Transcript_27789/g.49222  ORF Transcript_27789/g.49222 Transcript_27789/m.49222 type:complete len:152 (+) Transcript_27789:69-524(+)